MHVLIACEFSGVVREAFRLRGHDAFSCDLLPAADGSPYHFEGDALNLAYAQPWDIMIAHPPCTYLTNAGVRHLHSIPSRRGTLPKVHGPARWEAMREAAAFFNALNALPIPKRCIENPIPHGYAREIIGRYSQIIQPWQFGHGETKATCLWLTGLPLLQSTNIVAGRKGMVHSLSPSANRAMLRSITYKGIADAMAAQWG